MKFQSLVNKLDAVATAFVAASFIKSIVVNNVKTPLAE
jgi:hypothetical protein